jgi:hypothetical protein
MPVMPAAGEDSTGDGRRIAADAADEVRAPPVLVGEPEHVQPRDACRTLPLDDLAVTV